MTFTGSAPEHYCLPCNRAFASKRGLSLHNYYIHTEGETLAEWRKRAAIQAAFMAEQVAKVDGAMSMDNAMRRLVYTRFDAAIHVQQSDHIHDADVYRGAGGYQLVDSIDTSIPSLIMSGDPTTDPIWNPSQDSYQFESTGWLRQTQIACVPCDQKGCVLCENKGYYDD